MKDANITLAHTNRGASSGTSGHFSITDVQAGTYTLIVSYIGYQKTKKKIRLYPGQSLQLIIELVPRQMQLGNVVISTKSKKKNESKIGYRKIQTKFVQKVPAVFEADVFRALQLLPGVKASSDFSSGLYIRGGGPGQNLTLLDGVPVYNPTHFFGFYSTFNIDATKGVRLYKGGYPAKYGGRLGSVLSINSKNGNRKKFAGTASVGLLASRIEVEGPFKKGSWMVALRRSTLGPYLSFAKNYANYIPNKFHFWDFNGKVNYEINAYNKLSLTAYAGIDEVNFPLANSINTGLRYGNQVFSVNWSHILSPKFSSNLKLSGSRYFNYPSFGVGGIASERTSKILDFSTKGDVEYKPNDSQTFTAGFRLGYRRIKYKKTLTYLQTYLPQSLLDKEPFLALLVYFLKYAPENVQQSLPDSIRNYIQNYIEQHLKKKKSNLEKPVAFTTNTPYGSFYLQDKLRISNRWTITPGLRINGYGKGSYWRLGPRLSVEFDPTNRIRLQAAYGRYHQFMTLITNQAFSGFDSWLSADKGVKPASGNQYLFSVKANPKRGYGLSIETYYRTMNNLFDLNPFLPDLTGLNYDQLFRFGKGYAYGIDLSFQKRISRLTGSLSYSYSVTRRKFLHYNQSLSGQGGARFFPPRYDRRHDIKALVSYKLNSHWKTTAVFKYATGQAYTTPSERTRAVNLPFRSYPVDQLVINKVNASRLPPYQRLDISFSRSGTFFGMGKTKWQFQLINAYSHRNIWFYNYDFSQNPIQREAVKMLPILPNISYTIKL